MHVCTWSFQIVTSRWSGDVMKRPGQKILMPYPTTTCGPRCCFPTAKTLQDYFPCLPNSLLLNAKSKSWSRTDEICPRDRHVKFKNNTSGRERLWDTALKFLCPGLFITSPDHLDWICSTFSKSFRKRLIIYVICVKTLLVDDLIELWTLVECIKCIWLCKPPLTFLVLNLFYCSDVLKLNWE